MNNRTLFAAFLSLMSLSGAALADKIPMRSIEDATEANSRTVTLPSSDSGTLYFRDCSACNVQPLRLSANTRFYLGGSQVTFATLKNAVEQSKMTDLTIFYPPGEREVSRIIAFVAAK